MQNLSGRLSCTIPPLVHGRNRSDIRAYFRSTIHTVRQIPRAEKNRGLGSIGTGGRPSRQIRGKPFEKIEHANPSAPPPRIYNAFEQRHETGGHQPGTFFQFNQTDTRPGLSVCLSGLRSGNDRLRRPAGACGALFDTMRHHSSLLQVESTYLNQWTPNLLPTYYRH